MFSLVAKHNESALINYCKFRLIVGVGCEKYISQWGFGRILHRLSSRLHYKNQIKGVQAKEVVILA